MQKVTQSGEAAVGDISALLRAWSDGDQSALDKLTPIVYDELHRLARRYMKRERPGNSLQSAAQLMRRILVDHARRHNLKRGGGVQHVSLGEAAVVGGDQGFPLGPDLVAL